MDSILLPIGCRKTPPEPLRITILSKANQTLDGSSPDHDSERDRTGLLSMDRVHEVDRPRQLRLNK